MTKILLVEDDVMIASGVKYALEMEGYEVIHVTDIKSAFDVIKDNYFELAILDMQLPDGIGFDVSDKLKTSSTAIIFLTVVDDENTIVKAFENGSDDYIIKPFRIRELLARIKRTLSAKNSQIPKTNIIRIGDVEINTEAGKVYIDQIPVELTALEYRLLLIFANNKGVLLSRSQILDKIWDIDGNFVEDNTLTVYIKRLREKLGKSINIETVRGIGYRVD
ncbi:MAG: response regulator transcription factor [Lachnospiraceae bacterium]|nr:response regulator transcription factor [Lachnospiraceae bacterium]